MLRLLTFMFALRNRHFFLLDISFLLIIPTVALALRLDGLPAIMPYRNGLVVYTLISVIISLAIFYEFQLYSRYWRYASIDELSQIALAVFTSAVVIVTLFFSFRLFFSGSSNVNGGYLYDFADLPRSLPFIAALLKLFYVGGSRFGVRLIERWRYQRIPGGGRKVLIMGAGDAGAMIARELQRNSHLGLEAAGFLDDDAEKWGVRIHGLPVLGDRMQIPRAVQMYRAKQVIIAMPTASGKTIREIVDICESVPVQTKIIPGIYELLDGTVRVNQLRDVEIEDLLRREPVQTDIAAVKELIHGKRVLITGSGGSIGSELCRQVFRCGPTELVLLDHGENSIFAIHNELKQIGHNLAHVVNGHVSNGAGAMAHPMLHSSKQLPQLSPVIADIRFLDRLQLVFKQFRPEIVFHAAAHKHVPLMEANPSEAITNNVLGTHNLLTAALAVDVQHFVMISTDKAVNPTNIMGASKRAAELLVHQAARESGRPYVAVRFGNVLGSSGSVVLTFKQQIAAGGPVTVTHPDMRRYFMTIPEAVQLVLQAATLGKGDEVFVLDMGEPVRIVDLARDLIELSGLEVGRDIDIVFTSPRPGDKLFEELFINGEKYGRTCHEKIFTSQQASNFVPHDLEANLESLAAAAKKNVESEILACLKKFVPEFQHASFTTVDT